MKDVKAFNVRLPRETWLFLKMYCAQKETHMNKLLAEYVEKLKNNYEKGLTKSNAVVS